ncbi:hypothetical protein BGZ47_009280 [Haplosporangium gracile]|nr:hypothetical protein BGZ47_009280 [Haplosporangium gracile]
MRPLSASKVDNVKTLLCQGKSTRQVATELNVSHGFLTKIRLQGKENIPEPKMRRPTKVSKTTRQALKAKLLANDFKETKIKSTRKPSNTSVRPTRVQFTERRSGSSYE